MGSLVCALQHRCDGSMMPFSIAAAGCAGSPSSFRSLVVVVGRDVAAVGLAQLLTTSPVLSKGVGFIVPALVAGVGSDMGSQVGMMAPGSSGNGVFSFGVSVLAVNTSTLAGAAGVHIGASVLEKYLSGSFGSTDGVVEVLEALIGATVSTGMQGGASPVPKTKLSLLARG